MSCRVGGFGWMYEIEFYHDENDYSEIESYLDELEKLSETSKHERINRNKILAYIGALAKFGTRVGTPVVKHIEGNIWELRPLSTRIFFLLERRKICAVASLCEKIPKDTGAGNRTGEA